MAAPEGGLGCVMTPQDSLRGVGRLGCGRAAWWVVSAGGMLWEVWCCVGLAVTRQLLVRLDLSGWF